MVNERCAEAILANHHRDLWAEVKRIKGGGAGPSSVVDDYSSPADIAGFFAGKYQDLYTSVQFVPVDMAEINNKIFTRISVNGFDGDCIVTCEDIL